MKKNLVDGGLDPRKLARKRFLRKAIPYAVSLFNRAEALGLDWASVPMEQLSSYVILHEEFTRPSRMREHHEFA